MKNCKVNLVENFKQNQKIIKKVKNNCLKKKEVFYFDSIREFIVKFFKYTTYINQFRFSKKDQLIK